MRWRGRGVAAWLLLVALAGCGSVAATATPDPATAARYRDGLVAHSQALADAVVASNTACFEGPVEACARAAREQGAKFAEEARWVRDTPSPPGCEGLAGGYLGVVEAGERFFAAVGEAVASGEARRVTAALGEGYPAFIRALEAANGALVGEGCRQG